MHMKTCGSWMIFMASVFTLNSPKGECLPLCRYRSASTRTPAAGRFSDGGQARCYESRHVGGLPNPGNDRRSTKRNKYAKFSKTDKLAKDPLEAMIEESEAKLHQIELNSKTTRNQALPLDEKQRMEKRERDAMVFPDTREIDPYDPSTYGYTELGTITGAHGVHGLLKVSAVTEFRERFCDPGVRHLKSPSRRSPRKVQLLEGRHRLADEYLIKLEGVGDRDSAKKLRGSVLYARQEDRPKIVSKDEYLVEDLVGLEVFLEEGYGNENGGSDLGGHFVGTVGGIVLAEDVCAIPELGQDMLEVVLTRGVNGITSWKDELVLIPFVPEIVPRVDLDVQSIHITPPQGLLDLKYVREEKAKTKGFLPPAEADEDN